MAKYTIGGITFKNKDAITEHVRTIMNSKRPSDILAGDELAFMLALFEYGHKRWEQKKGVGIKFIQVQQDSFRNRFCVIYRVDDTFDDISWKEAISPATPEAEMKSCLRWEVVDQKRACSDAAFASRTTIVCPLSGRIITKEQSDVDHAPPNTFKHLTNTWIAANIKDFSAIRYIENFGGSQNFVDRDLAKSWQDYHRANAVLQVIEWRRNRWGK